MGERVLLAGGTEKSRELLQTLAAPGSWECCKLCHSGGETRRALGEGEWSLLIINTPLGDESGLELAMEAAGRTMAAVLLLVKAELADAVAARVEESGVMVVPKPVPRLLFDQALRFAMAARSRLTALRRENMRLEKKLEEMDVVFLMDRFGYAKTIDLTAYDRNREAADAENKFVFQCKNTGRICLFTNNGQLYTVKVQDLPFGKFRDKGIPIDNVSNFNSSQEELLLVTSQSELNLYRVIFTTRMGMIKVVDGGEFDVAKRTVAATKLQEGDEVVSVIMMKEQKNVILQSKDGYFLRFGVDEIPEKKKAAIGVRGMRLNEGDSIEAVYFTHNAEDTSIHYKSRDLVLNQIKAGKRDGKGTKIRA